MDYNRGLNVLTRMLECIKGLDIVRMCSAVQMNITVK